MRARTWSALGALALSACATASVSSAEHAHPDPPNVRLAVHLRCVGEEGEASDEEAPARRAAIEAVRYARGIEVAGGESDGALQAIDACAADIACIAARLRGLGARLGLLIVANLSTRPVLLTASLIDAATGKIEKSEVAETSPREIAAAARSLTASLLGMAGFPAGGRIAVRSHPGDVALTLSSTSSTSSTATRTVLRAGDEPVIAPGRYVLEASKQGFVSRSIPVEAHGAATTEVAIDLEPERSVLGSWWLWISVGALVAGATAAAFVATHRSDSPLTLDQVPMSGR